MPSRSKRAFSRRQFLGTVAALPFAAKTYGASAPRVAVVGAGAFGGWTALHLRSLGADVVLVDARGPGNTLSSSGGDTRVIRAIYGRHRIYSEMVKRAFPQWERIDAATESRIYTETGVLWMHRGDDGYVRAAAPILQDLGFPLEKLTSEEAARRFPQINFAGIQSVWLEGKGGVLSASRACGVVRDEVTRLGGTYRTGEVRPPSISGGALSGIQLKDGSRVEADVYVFACGPWLGEVFPDLIGERVTPTLQEVFYFGVSRRPQRYLIGQLPVWVDFGERIVYGIPAAPGRGFKVADDTRGQPVDPDSKRTRTRHGLAGVRKFLSERFPEMAGARLRATHLCLYENSPDGHLIVDRHPEAGNVWLLGGGSGHGFKLAPIVGEIAADAVISGKAVPEMFRLERIRDLQKRSTQFEA